MTDIAYPTFSQKTRTRLEQLIRRKAPSARAKAFLTLCLNAVDSTPPAGLAVDYNSDAFLVSCDRERLGELLQCSSKTVQRALQPGGEFWAFASSETEVIRNAAGLPCQHSVIVVFMDALERLPDFQPDNAREALLMRYGHGLCELRERFFAERAAAAADQTEYSCQTAADAVESDVHRDVLSDVHRDVLSDVQSLMIMNHEFMSHEGRKDTAFHDQQESSHEQDDSSHATAESPATATVQAAPAQDMRRRAVPTTECPGESRDSESPDDCIRPQFRFCEMAPVHLLAIAGQKVPCRDGVDRVAPPRQRVALLDSYLQDAIAAGRASPGDRRMLLALIICVARKEVASKPGYMFRCWENRHQKDLLNLTTASDRSAAAELLRITDGGTP